MNIQLENTIGHISHLAGALLDLFYAVVKNGFDLSKILLLCIDFSLIYLRNQMLCLLERRIKIM
jgi:hypothetical protein